MDFAYKCYEGSKRLNQKGFLPLLIVVAQRDDGSAFSEHYIFTGLDNPSFFHCSTGYSHGREEREKFNEIVTLTDVLAAERERAKADFESGISEFDKELHRSIFWDGSNYEYRETDDSAFLRLALGQACEKGIAEMFEKTQSQALEAFERLWNVIRKFNIEFT